MKLRHKIAGTFALPLALAIAASTANAATVVDTDAHTLKIGGFVAAQAGWTIYDKSADDSDVDFGMDLGTSRLNIAYTQKTAAGDITYLYENDWAGGQNYRLRHAAIFHDGWVAGYTWSGFANLTGLSETIDATGTSGNSANAQRTATLGKNITVADGMSVGVFIEDHTHGFTTGGSKSGRTANTPLPDLVANFKGDFGVAQAFAAVRMQQVDKDVGPDPAETEAKVDFTLGVNSQVTDELNLKAAVTSFDGDDLGFSVAGQYKITDQIRTNLVVEQFIADADDSDYTAIWVNAFYKMDSGWEWGAELRSVSADDGYFDTDLGYVVAPSASGLGDKDMSFTLQAKYAF